MTAEFDVIIVGGGLAGCLVALRLSEARPGIKLCIVESAPQLCGNHTWSFFETDLSGAQRDWIDPLLDHRWPGYEVRFPDSHHTLSTGYRSMTSDTLRAAVMQRLRPAVRLGTRVGAIGSDHAEVDGLGLLRAPCVIDARGGRPTPGLAIAFQKFLGQEVRLAQPHGMRVPIVMDATVAQTDGYRFVYTLPLDATRLLIEDTYYSDGGELPSDALRARIAAYAADKGWDIADVVREEQGVLPIILAGDHDSLVTQPHSAPRVGLAAALVHPTTGYSLPDAMRVADLIAARLSPGKALTSDDVRDVVHGYSRTIWEKRGYYRFLNRMLFQAAKPSERHRILARFYLLDQSLIERFYAAGILPSDKMRIFLHMLMKPPIPISSALACLSEASAFRAR